MKQKLAGKATEGAFLNVCTLVHKALKNPVRDTDVNIMMALCKYCFWIATVF